MLYFFKELIKWFKKLKEPVYVKIHENTHAHFEDHRKQCLKEKIFREERLRRKRQHIIDSKYRGTRWIR